MTATVQAECCAAAFNRPLSTRVDHQRFLQLYPKISDGCSVAPLVVWQQIRSFIKGSVEAVLRDPISGLVAAGADPRRPAYAIAI